MSTLGSSQISWPPPGELGVFLTRRNTLLAPPVILSACSLKPSPPPMPITARFSVEARTPTPRRLARSPPLRLWLSDRPLNALWISAFLPVTSKRDQVSHFPPVEGVGS